MAQRIKTWLMARALAFKAGVEEAEEGLVLGDVVHPVLPIPFVPPPAASDRWPFADGMTRPALAANVSGIGVRNENPAYILHVKRVYMMNRTGAATTYQLSIEDGPLAGVVVSVIHPAYVDAGPAILPNVTSIVAVQAAVPRGTSLMNGAHFSVPTSESFMVELDVYLNNGCLWLFNATVNKSCDAFFVGEVIPVIQAQTSL